MGQTGTVTTINLSGLPIDALQSARQPKLLIHSKTVPHTLLLREWSDVRYLEHVLSRGHQFSYLAHYEKTPYDTVHIAIARGKNEWLLCSSTRTGKVWLHCKMPGGHGIISRL